MSTLDFTKPVQTRDGCPVRILITDLKSDYPVVGVVTEKDGSESVQTFTPEGRFFASEEGPMDLVQAAVVTYKYRKVLKDGGISGHADAAEALQRVWSGYPSAGILKQTFHDGELVNVEFIPA